MLLTTLDYRAYFDNDISLTHSAVQKIVRTGVTELMTMRNEQTGKIYNYVTFDSDEALAVLKDTVKIVSEDAFRHQGWHITVRSCNKAIKIIENIVKRKSNGH